MPDHSYSYWKNNRPSMSLFTNVLADTALQGVLPPGFPNNLYMTACSQAWQTFRIGAIEDRFIQLAAGVAVATPPAAAISTWDAGLWDQAVWS